MQKEDWIIYYSPTQKFGKKLPCQAFTSIGQIEGDEPYPFQMSNDFVPYRRNVKFLPANELPILPLIDSLTFITDKKKWGYSFRRGFFSISEADFQIIADRMIK